MSPTSSTTVDLTTMSTPPVFVGAGSANSAVAVDLAADEAAARRSGLVLVHVVDAPGDHRALVTGAALAISRRHAALPVDFRIVAGDPATVLASESRGGCLLVVGHRGHCGHRTGGGSVAEQTVALATVPVLVQRSVHALPGTWPVLVGLAPGGWTMLCSSVPLPPPCAAVRRCKS